MTAGAERIQLHGGGGEPMMSRSFWNWVSHCSGNANAEIEFHTNGLLLSPCNIDRLMQHRVAYINISCDAATQETYRKIRGGDWDRLMRNISALSKVRSERRPDMHLRLNMTVMRDNAHEMPALVRMAYEYGVEEVEFYKSNDGPTYTWAEHTRDGYTFDYQSNLPERNADYVRPFFKKAVRVGRKLGVGLLIDERLRTAVFPASRPSKQSNPVQYSSCDAPWRWLSISATGDVCPCCSSVAPLGNLKDIGLFTEIWNGEAVQRLRRNIRGNEVDPICKGASCI
jgi:MoaA/NifB/PqqE/SkfB family radical SAM enzyme